MPFRVRVPIDLNDVDKDGLTVVRFGRAGVALRVGEEVIAYEAEDGVEAPAIVERLHPTREVAYVRVDRSRMESIDPAEEAEGTIDCVLAALAHPDPAEAVRGAIAEIHQHKRNQAAREAAERSDPTSHVESSDLNRLGVI